MSPADDPRVAAGRIAVTRLYDLGYEADLDRIEREARDSTTRLQLTRARPKAVFYTRPPVDIALGRTTVQLDDQAVEVDVRARVYDFAATRLSYELRVESMAWGEYVDRVNAMERLLSQAAPWDADVARLRALTAAAIERPMESGLELDYVVASIERFEPSIAGEDLAGRVDLVPILTGDLRPVAESARRDILRHAYSYYDNDLVVISWARALILEPGGETDVADILATAQAQVLELRYYDERLDRELPLMYDRIDEARTGIARRRYSSLAKSLHTLLAEVTEVSERIDNALVVTEDVHLARVYRAALEQYRVHDWRVAVDRKLSIIRDTYTALYDESTAERAEFLEIIIVVLIAIEIVLAFLA